MKQLLTFVLLAFSGTQLFAQEYTWNKNATKDNCHCYTLTQDANNQSGSVWNNNKIDLTQAFDFKFDIYLGCNDGNGADGIAFVLQPISTSVGGQGGGMGYSGVGTSVGVTLDDFQNSGDNDPAYDHIDIQYNGNVSHPSNPPRISATADNVEDCNWHTLRIKWEPSINKLTVYFDDAQRISATRNIIADIFHNDPKVFWGFTGATGGSKNLQQFCTALTPKFYFLPDQKKCFGEVVEFKDSTQSFGPVKSWEWNFGDGSPIDRTQNPTHTYIAPGNYNVNLTVEGADLCKEQLPPTIVKIGDFPEAKFSANDACFDAPVTFTENSTVNIGTINKWNWDIDGAASILKNPPVQTFSQLADGKKMTVKLSVTSDLGCSSTQITKEVKIFSQPIADITGMSGCDNGTFSFTGKFIFTKPDADLNGTINTWNWDFGDGKTAAIKDPQIALNTATNTTVKLQVTSTNGCKSTVVSKPIVASSKPVALFKSDDNICIAKEISFIDQSTSADGAAIAKWAWNINSTPYIDKDPKATFNSLGEIDATLIVETTNGCRSDPLTKKIQVVSGPSAQIDMEGPLCENALVRFKDASPGNITEWLWKFDDNKTSAAKDPLVTVGASGSHLVTLTVKDATGCGSNTATKNFVINGQSSVRFSFTGGCKNTPVIFKGVKISGADINDWMWHFGDNTSADIQNTEHTYTKNDVYNVSLHGVDVNGCYSDTAVHTVDIRGATVFAGNDIVATFNQPIQLSATINTAGDVIYQWLPSAGLNDATIANPVATINEDQTFIVKATTTEGCTSEDEVKIKVYKGPEIYVPSAFTPDGSGVNDILKVVPAGIVVLEEFTIYNRLGQRIFTTSDHQKGWDGRFMGVRQNSGTYVWIAKGVDYKGNKILRRGTLLLIR